MYINIKAAVAAALFATSAQAVNVTVTLNCPTCANTDDLAGATNGWAQRNYPLLGTYILMWSGSTPVSRVYTVKQSARGVIFGSPTNSCSTTQDCNKQANDLDQRIFHRNLKIEPITVNLPDTVPDADIVAALQAQAVWSADQLSGASTLHDLGLDFPVIGWFSVSVNNGPDQKWFIGDLFTVIYGTTGYTEQWVFTGMSTGDPPPWHKNVPLFTRYKGSLRYKGKLVTPPTNIPATPMANQSPANAATTWPQGVGITQSDATLCFGTSTLTVTAPDGSSVTGFGDFVFCSVP